MTEPLPESSERPFCQSAPRGLRAATNFARMATGFILSLWLVRLLLAFGSDACAVILLLASAGGLCAILQALARSSLTPVLALAYHEDDTCRQRGMFASSVFVCVLASAMALVGFFLLGLALDWLKIPEELLAGVRWFVAAKAAQAVLVLAVTPRVTMYLVERRMGVYNLCLLAERVADVASALLVLWLAPADPAQAIAYFGLFSATLHAVALSLVVTLARRGRPAMAFQWSDANWSAVRGIFHSVRGNSAVVLAMALYARFDMMLLNLTGGLAANLVFSLAVQLSGYTRLITQGNAMGIESAAARNVVREGGSPTNLRKLIQANTRQQAMLFLPAMLLLAALALPIVQVWVGSRVPDPEQMTAALATVLRLMLLGMAARAFTDGWMAILNGAGFIHAYARRVLLGALVNVLTVSSLIWIVPASRAIYFVAIVYTVLHIIVHFVSIPLLLKQLVGMRLDEIFSPVIRPLAVTVGCLPLLATGLLVERWNIVSLGIVAGVYLAAYGVASYWITLTADERESVWRLVRFGGRHAAMSMLSTAQADDTSGMQTGRRTDNRPRPHLGLPHHRVWHRDKS